MTRVIMCDKCKTIMMNDTDSHTIKVSCTEYDGVRSTTDLYFHICQECFNDFKKFMNVEVEEPND